VYLPNCPLAAVVHLSAGFKGTARRCHRTVATALFLAATWLPAATGCGTYSQELERARRHYQALEFPRALAVLRALGQDFDALSPAERAQYTYLRGMTDFRLSETVPPSGGLRGELRACARDWLDVSLSLDRSASGALTAEQTARARASLAQLVDVESTPKACLAPAVLGGLPP
jgi:hypothetical protein